MKRGELAASAAAAIGTLLTAIALYAWIVALLSGCGLGDPAFVGGSYMSPDDAGRAEDGRPVDAPDSGKPQTVEGDAGARPDVAGEPGDAWTGVGDAGELADVTDARTVSGQCADSAAGYCGGASCPGTCAPGDLCASSADCWPASAQHNGLACVLGSDSKGRCQ